MRPPIIPYCATVHPGGGVIQGCFVGGRPQIAQAAMASHPVFQMKPVGAPSPVAKPGAAPLKPGAGGWPGAPRLPGVKTTPLQMNPGVNGRLAQPTLPAPAGRAGVGPVQAKGSADAFPLPPGVQLRTFGGQPLPPAVQARMEEVFGADFRDVRVHIGGEAAAIGALAFTHGRDLYFAPGQYQPQTTQGLQLLGHELTHVVQQRAGRVRNLIGSGVVVIQDRILEAEADRMGRQAATHHTAQAATVRGTAQAFARPAGLRPPGPAAVPCGHPPRGRVVQRKGGKSEFNEKLPVGGENAVVTQMAYGGSLSHSVLFLEYIDPLTSADVLEMVHLKTLNGTRIETKAYTAYHDGKHISANGAYHSYEATMTEIALIKQEAQDMDEYWTSGRLTYASVKGSVTSSWRKATTQRTQDMTCKDVTDALLIAAGLRERATGFFFRHFWNPPSDI